jgi:hypothetical protein
MKAKRMEWDGWGMWQVLGRSENWWANLQERYHSEDLGAGGRTYGKGY